MFNKIKAVKELRDQAKKMKNQLDDVTAEGSAAWDKVKVVMNGNQKILSIDIADEMMKDKEKLQEELINAVNDAVKKIQKQMASKMKDMGSMQDMMKNLGL